MPTGSFLICSITMIISQIFRNDYETKPLFNKTNDKAFLHIKRLVGKRLQWDFGFYNLPNIFIFKKK